MGNKTEMLFDILRPWAKRAKKEDIEGFVKLPVFETEDEGLLCLIVNLMPNTDVEKIRKEWRVSKEMAEFLLVRISAAACYLGTDFDEGE